MPSRFDQPDAPPMASGNGKAHSMTLTCRDCRWSSSGRPVVVVSAAVRHAEELGHQVAYKGVVQQFSRRS